MLIDILGDKYCQRGDKIAREEIKGCKVWPKDIMCRSFCDFDWNVEQKHG